MTAAPPGPLLPADAAVALRSLPRRFRAATTPSPASDEATSTPPEDLAVLTLVVHTVRSLTLLDRALEQVLVTEAPVLHPAVLDRHRRTFDAGAHGSLEDVLAELDDIAPALADRVERSRPEDWHRVGRVAGHDEPVTALDLVVEAVDTAVTDLRTLQTAMRGASSGDG